MAIIAIDLSGDQNRVKCRVCNKTLEFKQTNEFVPFNKFANNKQQIVAFAQGHCDIHGIARQGQK